MQCHNSVATINECCKSFATIGTMQWITKGSKWTFYGKRFATSGNGNFVVELCILLSIWLANVVDRGGNLQIWKIYHESKRPFQRNIGVVH